MLANYGTCPICNGSGEVLLSDEEKKYIWNKNETHRACRNCGGQTMYGNASGQVPLNREGQPCVHSYTGTVIGRCLTEYVCKHCGHRYQIDSGD